ncbi:glycosyl hydrolase family 18 protein [Caldicellulosiruptoraceae bacterium PP1]
MKKVLRTFISLALSFTILLTSIFAISAPKKKTTIGTTTTNTTTTSTTTTASTTTTNTQKTVLGFTTYYYTNDSSSLNSLQNNYSAINEIVTATHVTDGYGNITGLIPVSQITYANDKNITPMIMIGNNFDGKVAQILLESEANRKNFINNLLNIIKNNGYKGVNIDLEGVYYYDRNYYTTLVSEVYNTLKPLGFKVTISVPAKTYDSLTNSWNGAYDYKALSNYVDEMIIMTYDEHYPGGSPGPVASIGWVENVIKYTLTVVPKEKVLLGVAAYGYDWSSLGTKAYSINGCYSLAQKNGAAIIWDDISKTSYFNYVDSSGISHSVWFEDAKSLQYKIELVNKYGLKGIGIWRLGLENSEYWGMIKLKFNK